MIRIFLLLQNTRFKGRTKECLFHLKCHLFSPPPPSLISCFDLRAKPHLENVWCLCAFLWCEQFWVLTLGWASSCVSVKGTLGLLEKTVLNYSIYHIDFFWSWSLNLFFLFTWYTIFGYGDWGWCGVRIWMKYNW